MYSEDSNRTNQQIPAASKKHLSVHFNAGFTTKLPADEVGIVR